MNKIAAIFPGQGSQTIGMGKKLWDSYAETREIFAEADAAVGFPLSELCFEGPEEKLRQTEFTQPAILTASYAAFTAAKRAGLEFTMAAGHSLGEFSALVAAETITFKEAVRAVQIRGQLMQAAVPDGVGGMMAVLGLDRAALMQICCEVSTSDNIVEAVNFNCPGQTVVAGHQKALDIFAEKARQQGAKKVVELPVSAPFHSTLLLPAAEKFAGVIDRLNFTAPKFPVASNVHGGLLDDPRKIKESLKKQLCSSVKWEECVTSMLAADADCFVEIGPGKVLCGFVKRIAKNYPCFNIEDDASLHKTIDSMGVD